MEVRLHVTHGKANVKEIVLGRETLIGRSSDCNLKITSSQVSRRHCRIQVTDHEVLITDLGSANGTLVNGLALPKDQPSRVASWNELEIGPLKFQINYIAPKTLPSDETVKLPETMFAPVPPQPAPATADADTVDFLLDERRRKQLQQAVGKPAADAVCPPTEAIRDEDDDLQGTVMDLNLSPQADEATPQFPVVSVDAVDDTVDLPDSTPPAPPEPKKEVKPAAKGRGLFGMFRRGEKTPAPPPAKGTPAKGTPAGVSDETTTAFSTRSAPAAASSDATVLLPPDVPEVVTDRSSAAEDEEADELPVDFLMPALASESEEENDEDAPDQDDPFKFLR